MNLNALLRSWLGRTPAGTLARPRRGFRPMLELLEDRLAPAVFTVSTNADSGTGSLRAAILLANADTVADTINFSAALNNQTITLSTGQLTIANPLTIAGPGATLLTIDADHLSRIFNVDDGTPTSIAVAISGLTLTGGLVPDNGGAIQNVETLTLANATVSGNSSGNGGGILNNGVMTVTNATVSGNSVVGGGGGILNNGLMTVTNSTLSGNFAALKGGGIFNNGILAVTNSIVSGNSAGLLGGGGIFNNLGTVTLTNATLSGNSCSGDGGGIFSNGTLTLTNSTFSGNSAAGNGGGILNNGSGALTAINVTLSGNSAAQEGGGIFIDASSTATLINSTLSGNSAGGGGGGGIFNDGTLTTVNSTLSANSASIGGGINNFDDGTLTLTNSTLFGNTAAFEGGGIANFDVLRLTNSTASGNIANQGGGGGIYNSGFLTLFSSTIVANRADFDAGAEPGGGILFVIGSTTLFNTIVAGNLNGPGAGTPDDLNGGFNVNNASANNLIGDPASAGGLSNATNGNIVGKAGLMLRILRPLAEILDPTLRNNGGPTLTHALIPGSVAIDAGGDSQVASAGDQRGASFKRIVGAHVDIGAYEMPSPLFTDNFDRANNTALGAPWVAQVGALGIVGNLAQGTGPSTVHIATLAGVSVADVDMSATLNVVPGQQAGIVARYAAASDPNFYFAALRSDAAGNTVARLVRKVNGVGTEMAVVEGVAASGVLRFRVVGSTLQLFLNGSLLATVEDTSLTSGTVGLATSGASTVDNFQASPVTTGADNFDPFTHPDYTTLSDPWTQVAGFYRTLGNKIQGGQALNLAVLNAVNQPDVDVQASVSITGINHTAGLVARYQSASDTNYLALVIRTSTGFTAQTYKRLNGSYILLSTASIASSTGKANLRFLVTGINLKFFVNNIPVADLLDTSLSTGSVGIRSDAYATLDDFHVQSVITNSTFADSFDQADATGLGINWSRSAGDFKVMGNMAVGVAPSPAVNLATLIGEKQANVEIQAKVALVTAGNEIGLVACQSGAGDVNYYMARVLKTAAGFNLSIVSNVGGIVTTLTSVNVAALTGGLEFLIQGTSLTLFMNGVEQLSTTDSALTAGRVGIRSIGTGTIDNFSATPVSFLPFNDNFDSDTLNTNWGIRAGGYTTTAVADKARGTATLNLMTLSRFNAPDVDVQADVNVLAGAGNFASLVARYSGPADDNMYLATIASNGTQFEARIAIRVGGSTTTLARVNIGTGAGTLRFTAVGGQLTLFLGGMELLSVFDFTLKTGSVGIRSSLDSTFDNFSASLPS